MSIDQKATQLEFPFLNQLRMQLYVSKQREAMKELWDGHYKNGNEYSPPLRFGDFIADVWIKGGYAKRFHESEHERHFYDSPEYTKVYTNNR